VLEGIADQLIDQEGDGSRLHGGKRHIGEVQRELDVGRLVGDNQIPRQVGQEFPEVEPSGAVFGIDQPLHRRHGPYALRHAPQGVRNRRILDAAGLEDRQGGEGLKVVLGPVIDVMKEGGGLVERRLKLLRTAGDLSLDGGLGPPA
jgi:hypothetical protein